MLRDIQSGDQPIMWHLFPSPTAGHISRLQLYFITIRWRSLWAQQLHVFVSSANSCNLQSTKKKEGQKCLSALYQKINKIKLDTATLLQLVFFGGQNVPWHRLNNSFWLYSLFHKLPTKTRKKSLETNIFLDQTTQKVQIFKEFSLCWANKRIQTLHLKRQWMRRKNNE